MDEVTARVFGSGQLNSLPRSALASLGIEGRGEVVIEEMGPIIVLRRPGSESPLFCATCGQRAGPGALFLVSCDNCKRQAWHARWRAQNVLVEPVILLPRDGGYLMRQGDWSFQIGQDERRIWIARLLGSEMITEHASLPDAVRAAWSVVGRPIPQGLRRGPVQPPTGPTPPIGQGGASEVTASPGSGFGKVLPRV